MTSAVIILRTQAYASGDDKCFMAMVISARDIISVRKSETSPAQSSGNSTTRSADIVSLTAQKSSIHCIIELRASDDQWINGPIS